MSFTYSVDFDFNPLSCSTEAPDVTLIVEGTEISAHRAILSERCEYFRAMFSSSFVEAKSDRIVLKETNLLAFKVVLKFIYTGNVLALYHLLYVPDYEHDTHSITDDRLFAVLQCAQYYMVDKLVTLTIHKLHWECSCNPGSFLKNALAYSNDELILYGTNFIQKEAHNLVEKKMYEHLTPLTWEYLLKLPLDTYESIIFEALVIWMRNNPDHSESFPKLLEHVELHLLDKAHLDMLFEPTQIINLLFLHNVLSQQRQQARVVTKMVNKNVIDNLRIIDGNKCVVGDETTIWSLSSKDIIVVDLKNQFLLNCLKLDFEYSTFYTISMSTDSKNWDLVIDHSKYECLGPQTLYFTERVVRFIKIQSVNGLFFIYSNVEARYFTDASSVEIDPDTTLIVPSHNLMPAKMLNIWSSTNNSTVGGWMNGEIVNGHIETKNTCSLVYEFRQPYIIGSLKLLLKEVSSYYVEIAVTCKNNTTWTRVISEENVTGWRIATFKRQPVVFINIVGTTADSRYFRLYNIECPAT